MKRGRKRQYTVRSVPPEVDRALRRQAKREGRSLNDVVLEALARGVGLDGEPHAFQDLDHLIGTWREDPKFDEAIADQDRVDTDLWH